MTLTQYFMLAAAFVIGAVVAGLVASWWIGHLRGEVVDLTADLAAATTRHERDLDDARTGWGDEYHRARNLRDKLDEEQARLSAADRDRAILRGRIADLQATIADYAAAWGDVPRAWRAHVNDLDEDARDDVWAPPLHPAPVLVGMLADPSAPRLPDEWVPESSTEWFAKIRVPVAPDPVRALPAARRGHKRKPSKAVTR